MITWKWLEGCEAERKESRWEDEEDGKELPTRRTWREMETERERREEMRVWVLWERGVE